MKFKIISFAAAVAFIAAPMVSQASDKEVQKPACSKNACLQKTNHQQVALFVSGRGVTDRPAPHVLSLPSAQTGQGMGVTFFTGDR